MSITIKDISRLAGVSVGTVSKVLNNKGNVKPNLALRVKAIVENLNYRPSQVARSFKQNKTGIIGLIIPKINNDFYIRVIDSIEKIINKKNYTLFLGNTDENIDTELHYLMKFANLRIEGLILATTGGQNEQSVRKELLAYKNLNIPIVKIVRDLRSYPSDFISIDNYNGAFLATKKLLEYGHRRIAIISSSAHTSASQERIDGYLHALEEYKVPFDSRLIHKGSIDGKSGYIILNNLLNLASPPTALFVASNYQLVSVLQAIKEKELIIPDDLSLICFDDPKWVSFLKPPLSAIDPLIEKLCEKSVECLFNRIKKTYISKPRSFKIPIKIINRSSIKKLKK